MISNSFSLVISIILVALSMPGVLCGTLVVHMYCVYLLNSTTSVNTDRYCKLLMK